jgi:hypothetical protein
LFYLDAYKKPEKLTVWYVIRFGGKQNNKYIVNE